MLMRTADAGHACAQYEHGRCLETRGGRLREAVEYPWLSAFLNVLGQRTLEGSS